MGEEYEKLVEILTVATDDNFILDSSRSYFDCTNYYFEIDKESTLQKRSFQRKSKGPYCGNGPSFRRTDVTSRHEDIPRQ